MKSKAFAANLALGAFAMAASGLLVEGILRVATPFPVTETSNRVPHAELLYTVDPDLSEIDHRGFRNPESTDSSYAIVAVGDSHTYGFNASPEETWPAALGTATGLTSYNFSAGGYSIFQYDVLFDMALRMHPSWILVGIYPANDFRPACDLLELEAWSSRVSGDTEDASCPGGAPVRRVDREGLSLSGLIHRTAIGSAMAELIWDPMQGRLLSVDLGGRTYTVGLRKAQEHQESTDLSDEGIQRRYRQGLEFARRWRLTSARDSIRLGVMVIPSRERVLVAWATRNGYNPGQTFYELTRNEEQLASRLMSDLDSLDIPAIDALSHVVDAFDEAVLAGTDLYPPGSDGHPWPPGYRAYARAAEELLASNPGGPGH